MTEQEMLERIRQSAEAFEVPESLSPESILEKCRGLEQEKPSGGEKGGKKFRIGKPKLIAGLSAAAVFTICCISLKNMGGIELGTSSGSKGSSAAMDMAVPTEAGVVQEESAALEAGIAEGTEECAMPEEAAEEVDESVLQEADAGAGGEVKQIERKDAGDLYTLAESYDAVYDRLEEIVANQNDWAMNGAMKEGMTDGAAMDTGADFAVAENAQSRGPVQDLQREEEKFSAEKEGFSRTNVQTFGIDESDIVKTDGEYIYLLRDSSVSIVSAKDGEMKQVGELEADTESGAANICAMYVDGDLLILMAQESETSLEETEGDEAFDYAMKYIDTDVVTSVITYDISDRKNPVLAGKTKQDGAYVTSRKDGSILYLFTDKYLMEDYGKGPEGVIPEVNARKIAEDCIYLGDRGERALIISSLSVNRPETVRDSVMILDNGSEIYMGEDSLYLYRSNYTGVGEATEIAKFSLKGGYLNGEAAASVRGSVRDTFAINEKNNKLRVLTTDTSGNEWENCLFLLDENLKVTGKLNHIAVGETIYAARYLGDMAYFITYRNMDPLFAADLSDEKKPKLVGELEITGFSEYLHFWGDDRLLGLGYETDPENGAQEGLKLVMFDMSDPAALKTLGSKVMDKVSYSPALYDYKAVLADPEENLIGFVTESYNRGVKRTYELYRWNGSGFEKILSEKLDDGYEGENYRGLYVGERFYIAHPEVVRYYDREDYKLKQKLEME